MIPTISLVVGAVFLALAYRDRSRFSDNPYLFWFLYLHMAAVGVHQFEEYVWPGGFRDFLASVFPVEMANETIPSATSLEILNVAGFLPLFAIWGWLGIKRPWLGLALLFLTFGNGWFHLTYAVTRFTYNPGTVTGALLFIPLGLFGLRHAIRADDVTPRQLVAALALGTAASFAPFVHFWMSYLVLGS